MQYSETTFHKLYTKHVYVYAYTKWLKKVAWISFLEQNVTKLKLVMKKVVTFLKSSNWQCTFTVIDFI